MQQRLSNAVLDRITYLVGSADTIKKMLNIPTKAPFEDGVLHFLDDVSKYILKNPEAKAYPDVITLGFWMRKASIMKLKEKYKFDDLNIHIGRGIVFHVAPSNVPVNYAYSLVSGLLTGNANIVRIPSKDFPQVNIINNAILKALDENENIKKYVVLARYEREREINDMLSSIADVRIIWGGDLTISEIRKSPLSPRGGEITFADRYSFAIIDSDVYLANENKAKVAEDFYNDTYLTDQNACTSPRLVVWIGNSIEQAKELFWNKLHDVVLKKYTFQPIQGINKLTSAYLMAVHSDGVRIITCNDNLIYRIELPTLIEELMDMKDNSGYFFEYGCSDILELRNICNDKKCQTISYLGNKEILFTLVKLGIKGIDRIVPMGHTMDFDLIWDGYDLVERLTRTISVI